MARNTPIVSQTEKGSEKKYFIQSFLKDFHSKCVTVQNSKKKKMELTDMGIPSFVSKPSQSKFKRGQQCLHVIVTADEKKVLCNKKEKSGKVSSIAMTVEDRVVRCLTLLRHYYESNYRSEGEDESDEGDCERETAGKKKRKAKAHRPTVISLGNTIMQVVKKPLKDLDTKKRLDSALKRLKIINEQVLSEE